ncbi:hypothetical protein ABE494_02645 [Stenotrophomonas lactitubi]|uniref:hypothetical protein n=1 Tax=Stenotrophomonas lactitubi TaxID=2045214 RepID=UPI000FBA0E4B
MRWKIAILVYSLSVLLLIAFRADEASASDLISIGELDVSYMNAISEVASEEGIDRSWEMRRCISNWSVVNAERKEMVASLRGGRSILIEVGTSGFASHEFVAIDGYAMTSGSNGGAKVDLEGGLRHEVEAVYASGSRLYASSVSQEVDDGSCYFLTVFDEVGSVGSVVVLYGGLSGDAGSFVRDVLARTRGH